MTNSVQIPGERPLVLWALYTYLTVAGETSCRVFIDSNQANLETTGKQMEAEKPSEASAFGFMVLPVEGLAS